MITKTRKPRLRELIRGIEFTNPRTFAAFTDWPAANERVKCRFAILRGNPDFMGRLRESAIRWTIGKPRIIAGWHDWARIVDGSDGRTYVVCYSGDRQGPDGRAVVYGPSLKPECVIYDAPGFHYNQIRQLRNMAK